MGVTLYRSIDASAPVLTGQTGSLVALLDAILVNGYGSQPAAGWTIAFTGTSKRDYKQGTGSNGYYLDVDDSGPGGGTFREARMRGYEAMTALGTGTQAFPTTGQLSAGITCRKSTTADSTARPWYCVADSTCFYLFVDTGDITSPSYAYAFMFGDFFSYKSGDTNNCLIMGRNSENTNNQAYEAINLLTNTSLGPFTTLGGHYTNRAYNGVGGSAACGKFASLLCGVFNLTGLVVGSSLSVLPYPNGPDGGMVLSPMYICQGSSIRGYLKGLWAPCHNQPFGHGDIFNGSTASMNGKTFMGMWSMGNPNGIVNGSLVVETSNTWS